MRSDPRSEPPNPYAVRARRLVATAASLVLVLLSLAPVGSAGAQVPDDRVFILGDSIVVAAEPYILEALPDHTVTVDAVVGRPTTDAARILSERRAELGSIVVVQLGANDAGWGFPAKVESTMTELKDVPVVIWINQNDVRPEFVSANEVLASAAARWPNLVIADWNSYSRGLEDAVRPDGVHLTRTGAREYGLMIANAVISQTPRAWSAITSTTIAPTPTTAPVPNNPDTLAADFGSRTDEAAGQADGSTADDTTSDVATDDDATDDENVNPGFEEAVRLAVAGGGRAGTTGRIAGIADELSALNASDDAGASSSPFGLDDDLTGVGTSSPSLLSSPIVPLSSNRAGTSESSVALVPETPAAAGTALFDELVDEAEVLGTNTVRAEDDNLLDASELQTPLAGDPLEVFDGLDDEQAVPALPDTAGRGMGPIGYLIIGTILALIARVLISALQAAPPTPR